MNWELCLMSTLLSTLIITTMLWYTTNKEKEDWVVLFHLLSDLQKELEGNNLKGLIISIDQERLKETLSDCIEILETKIDETEKNDHYYNQNGIEAWDIIKQVMKFHEGNITNNEAGIVYNIMKYLLRFPYKGQRNDDLDKVCVYVGELKETINND